jgi:hypothetical protein
VKVADDRVARPRETARAALQADVEEAKIALNRKSPTS